jgi:Spy/CpxP family protein refolding chaperone
MKCQEPVPIFPTFINLVRSIMNRKKIALLMACGVSLGLSAIAGSAFAANSPAKKPAISQPAYPEAHEKDHCDEHESGMMGHSGHGMMDEHEGGMMGGHGSGMMMESPRMNMVRALDLSDEQRSRINKLSDELHHNNWAAQGSIMDESAKLRDLYEADKRDPATIGNVYQKIFDLKRKMIEAMIDTQNHVEELLTPEQILQLKNMHHMKGMHHMPIPMHDHPMN